MQNILIFCWLFFLLYWFVSAFSVKPTQEVKWSPSRFRWIACGIIFVILLASKVGVFNFLHLPACTISWWGCHFNLFHPSSSVSPFIQMIGVIFTIAGLIVAVIARKTLGSNWSSDIELKKNHELITKGIYGYVRHPIYTGILMMGLGSLLFFHTEGLIIIYLFVILFCVFKLINEEALMLKHFPKEYKGYKKRVKALIPFIL